jgi:hypothetical protein
MRCHVLHMSWSRAEEGLVVVSRWCSLPGCGARCKKSAKVARCNEGCAQDATKTAAEQG